MSHSYTFFASRACPQYMSRAKDGGKNPYGARRFTRRRSKHMRGSHAQPLTHVKHAAFRRDCRKRGAGPGRRCIVYVRLLYNTQNFAYTGYLPRRRMKASDVKNVIPGLRLPKQPLFSFSTAQAHGRAWTMAQEVSELTSIGKPGPSGRLH